LNSFVVQNVPLGSRFLAHHGRFSYGFLRRIFLRFVGVPIVWYKIHLDGYDGTLFGLSSIQRLLMRLFFLVMRSLDDDDDAVSVDGNGDHD
jgi:hypothetical protein